MSIGLDFRMLGKTNEITCAQCPGPAGRVSIFTTVMTVYHHGYLHWEVQATLPQSSSLSKQVMLRSRIREFVTEHRTFN